MHIKTLLAGASALAIGFAASGPVTAVELSDLPDLTGQTLTISGPWILGDGENFEAVLDKFREVTGATVEHTGSDSFEQQIVIDTQAGSPPNIAIFPQPGLASTLAAQGLLTPLGEDDAEWVKENYAAGQSWLDLGTYPDENGDPQFFGFVYKADLKSLVWYVPDNFADAGYEVPQTMEELIALSDQIVEDGGTPWCMGIGAEAATGWPATDWVEELMLRTQPPEVYDQWVTNEIPFNDPRIINAIETYGMFAKNDEWVNGGAQAVATTTYRDAPAGLFTVPPQCYMLRQASFISTYFPEGTELGTDADFFYFPSYADKDLGNPVLGGGTLFAITDDSPAARAFMDYLKTNEANEIWMARSGMLSPLLTVDLNAYANDTLRKQGEILLNATTFRFDGSDLMPSAIGAGAFWTAMVDYVGGKSAEEVTTEVQEAWDALK